MFLSIKKYLFASLVAVYLLMVSGIPVYFHYCGGELEEISYLIKSSDCCGGETPTDDDCCKDQNVVLIASPDVTLSNIHKATINPAHTTLFALHSISIDNLIEPITSKVIYRKIAEPPNIQAAIISTSVLRI